MKKIIGVFIAIIIGIYPVAYFFIIRPKTVKLFRDFSAVGPATLNTDLLAVLTLLIACLSLYIAFKKE
jgi:hypothetical protein